MSGVVLNSSADSNLSHSQVHVRGREVVDVEPMYGHMCTDTTTAVEDKSVPNILWEPVFDEVLILKLVSPHVDKGRRVNHYI